jgi:hypothetical protein
MALPTGSNGRVTPREAVGHRPVRIHEALVAAWLCLPVDDSLQDHFAAAVDGTPNSIGLRQSGREPAESTQQTAANRRTEVCISPKIPDFRVSTQRGLARFVPCRRTVRRSVLRKSLGAEVMLLTNESQRSKEF